MTTRATFLERFLLPLVAGGEVHVGAPLGARGLANVLHDKANLALEAKLEEARLAVAKELQVCPIPPTLDEEAVRLAVALHDMLFLYHPVAGSPAGRPERIRRVALGAAAIARLPRTVDADVLVARHTVLHQLPSL